MLWSADAVGLHDIELFLKAHPPFHTLSAQDLSAVVRKMSIAYYPSGSTVALNSELLVVRRGSLQVQNEEYGSGDVLGLGLQGEKGQAQSDTWCYQLSAGDAEPLLKLPAFVKYFSQALSEHLPQQSVGLDLSTVLVSEVMKTAVMATPEKSVQEIARVMRDKRVSSVLFDLPEGIGILTDKDLRNKVLAEGLSSSTPAQDILTPRAWHLPHEASALQALQFMLARNIRHLPITQNGVIAGVVGASDILRWQSKHPGYVVQDIQNTKTPADLVSIAKDLPNYAVNLWQSGQKASQVAKLHSLALDALYKRAIEQVISSMGTPPRDFAWVLLGSIARREMGLNPDQDHVIVYQGPETDYFVHLAEHVGDILEQAGLPKCEGGVMASQHCYTEEQYFERLESWYHRPEPEALLNTTIFFDPRVVYGTLNVDGIRNKRLSAKQHPLFMTLLTRNALRSNPPLGLFGRIQTDHGMLDIKHKALALIIDLARIHALTVQESSPNTLTRLNKATPEGVEAFLSPDALKNLASSYEYLLELRFAHHARQFLNSEPVDNMLPFDKLPRPDQVHLRAVFKLLAQIHSSLTARVGQQ